MFFCRFTLKSYPRWYFELLTRWNSDSPSKSGSRNDLAGFFCDGSHLRSRLPSVTENACFCSYFGPHVAKINLPCKCFIFPKSVQHDVSGIVRGIIKRRSSFFWGPCPQLEGSGGSRNRQKSKFTEKSGDIVSRRIFWRGIRISTSYKLKVSPWVRYERKTTQKHDFEP